jgi:hypothetical protein
MKKLIITESERRNILKSHGSIILEQSATDKLKAIQSALGTTGDAIIGPDTTKRIVDTLKSSPTKSDFTCVTNNPNKKSVAFDDEKVGYQIGEFVFDKLGNYYDVKDSATKNTYTCSGTTIQTSKHGNIESGTPKVDNTGVIKSQISNLRNQERDDDFIVKSLLTKYTKEEILKADSNLKSILDKTESKPGETQKPPVDMSKREESGENYNETTIKNLGKQQFYTGG